MKKWKKNLLSFLSVAGKPMTLDEIYLGSCKGKSKMNVLSCLSLFEQRGIVKTNKKKRPVEDGLKNTLKKSPLHLDFDDMEFMRQNDIRYEVNKGFLNIKDFDKKEVKP